jgi:hypothetical protein
LRIGVLIIGSIAIITAAFWAQSPIAPIDTGALIEAGSPSATASDEIRDADRPDPALFAVDLWYTPPTPQAVPAPPKLPKLELLGITSVDGSPAAIIFDQESDTMVTLRVGETHGPTTVTAITTESIDCIAHDRAFSIALGESTP